MTARHLQLVYPRTNVGNSCCKKSRVEIVCTHFHLARGTHTDRRMVDCFDCFEHHAGDIVFSSCPYPPIDNDGEYILVQVDTFITLQILFSPSPTCDIIFKITSLHEFPCVVVKVAQPLEPISIKCLQRSTREQLSFRSWMERVTSARTILNAFISSLSLQMVDWRHGKSCLRLSCSKLCCGVSRLHSRIQRVLAHGIEVKMQASPFPSVSFKTTIRNSPNSKMIHTSQS